MARALCTQVLLVYEEGYVTEFAHQLLPALAKASDPENPQLAAAVGKCAMVFAQHTEPNEYRQRPLFGPSGSARLTYDLGEVDLFFGARPVAGICRSCCPARGTTPSTHSRRACSTSSSASRFSAACARTRPRRRWASSILSSRRLRRCCPRRSAPHLIIMKSSVIIIKVSQVSASPRAQRLAPAPSPTPGSSTRA